MSIVGDGAAFFSVRLHDLLNYGMFLLAGLKYQRDRERDTTDRIRVREEKIKEDAEHHAQNTAKLDVLMTFQREQLILNRQRDQQVHELREQTAILGQIAKDIDRRLVMLEEQKND